MQLENEFSVPAPVSEVWKTLLDVERIAPCMPGATVERVDGDEVAGRVRVKVGPVTSTVAMPVLKRFGPVLGGVAFGLILGLLLGHRRRIVIMTAAAPPGGYPPARTVL